MSGKLNMQSALPRLARSLACGAAHSTTPLAKQWMPEQVRHHKL